VGTLPAMPSLPSGHVVTGADQRTIADSVSFLLGASTGAYGQRPLAVMRQTVAQSIPNATPTAILLDATDVDRDGGHSTNTSWYIANTAGWYQASAVVAFISNATGARFAWLQVNGATRKAEAAGPPSSGFETAQNVTDTFFLNVGDYVEAYAYQSSGGALNTFIGLTTSRMTIAWQGS